MTLNKEKMERILDTMPAAIDEKTIKRITRSRDEGDRYIFKNRVLCGKCGRGDWHKKYFEEHGHWFNRYDEDNNRQYASFDDDETWKGCGVCGGYGYCSSRFPCPGGCGEGIWHRPDPMTMYDGKEYTSVCGTELVHRFKDGSKCKKCDSKSYVEPDALSDLTNGMV